MRTVLIESQYLPSVAYFSLIEQAEEVIIEKFEFFEKQSFRNRCRIQTATKTLNLSIPVHHQGKKVIIENLKIDYVQKWQNTHWRSIETAYRKAPFFDYYADPIKDIIYSNVEYLFDINNQLLTICLKFLQIDTPIKFTTSYVHQLDTVIFDARSYIHPKKPLSDLHWFEAKTYYQIFGKDFAKNITNET